MAGAYVRKGGSGRCMRIVMMIIIARRQLPPPCSHGRRAWLRGCILADSSQRAPGPRPAGEAAACGRPRVEYVATRRRGGGGGQGAGARAAQAETAFFAWVQPFKTCFLNGPGGECIFSFCHCSSTAHCLSQHPVHLHAPLRPPTSTPPTQSLYSTPLEHSLRAP